MLADKESVGLAGVMNVTSKIDLKSFHQVLYNKSDRLHRLKIKQRDLAVEVGLRFETVCRWFKILEEQSKIKRLGTHSRNVQTYLIRDPSDFKE